MVERELPKYKCHKEVWALKIEGIKVHSDPSVGEIIPFDAGYAPFVVTEAYMKKHNPQPGGYYVVYDDGYTSYSPAAAFEKGYTKIN